MGVDHAKRRGKRLGRPALRKLTGAELEASEAGPVGSKTQLRALAQKHRISVWAAQQAVSALDSAAYKTTDSRQPGTAKFGLEIRGLRKEISDRGCSRKGSGINGCALAIVAAERPSDTRVTFGAAAELVFSSSILNRRASGMRGNSK
jgi:hypothetical protein